MSLLSFSPSINLFMQYFLKEYPRAYAYSYFSKYTELYGVRVHKEMIHMFIFSVVCKHIIHFNYICCLPKKLTMISFLLTPASKVCHNLISPDLSNTVLLPTWFHFISSTCLTIQQNINSSLYSPSVFISCPCHAQFFLPRIPFFVSLLTNTYPSF